MLWEQNNILREQDNNVVGTKCLSCVNKIISCGNKIIMLWEQDNNVVGTR